MQTQTNQSPKYAQQTNHPNRRQLDTGPALPFSLLFCFVLATSLSLIPLRAQATHDAFMDFESPPLGTEYGAPVSDAPGDTVLTEDNIKMTVENYHSGAYTGFYNGIIDPSSSMGFGTGQVLELASLDARFHFTDLPGTPPDTVTIDYLTTNMGNENLDVNGTQHEPVWFSLLDGTTVATGVQCQVTVISSSTYSEEGIITLIGDIETVQIGGQELQIDNLHYKSGGGSGGPGGPSCWHCDYEVTHETLAVGAAWGAPHGDSPGDLAFVEDGIPVRLRKLQRAVGTDFDECVIEWSASGFGEDNYMRFDKIAVSYEIHALGLPVEVVIFYFADWMSSIDNMQVNGGPMHIGDIESFPTNIAPGVTYHPINVTPLPGGGVSGIGVLLGNVQKLRLGGEQFYVDEVCVLVDKSGGYNCDREVRFEDEPLGTGYGSLLGDSPGDQIFIEDAIRVSVDYYTDGSGWDFNNCYISDAAPDLGVTDGQAMGLYAVSNVFDFTFLHTDVDTVIFEFVDWAGIENLGVNGPMVYYGQMADMPENIAPGVTCEVTSWPIPSGEAAGRVVLVGDVETLWVGGQQFLLDNVCAILSDGSSAQVSRTKPEKMLHDPFPNPLNPATTVSFSLPSAMPVKLNIYNLAGERVATLMDGMQPAGKHSVVWDGRNSAGRMSASGIYFARLEAAGIVEAKKLMLLK
jgi:hypothetical protein